MDGMKLEEEVEEEEELEEEVTPLAVRCEVIEFLIKKYGPPTTREVIRLLNNPDAWIKEVLHELRKRGKVTPVHRRWKLVEPVDKFNPMYL
jgi:hypothetical protein